MNYSERDAAAIWHPYTQMQLAPLAVPIVRAEGVYLYDANERPLIDAASSWWVNLHGHSHPHIVEKVHQQLKNLDHVMFAGFTHPVAIELAERLLAKMPKNQSRIFYSDNGSTAVEAALKMAIQYWYNQGKPKRKIIHLDGAYHGDTFGAMASSEHGAFTRPFQSMFFETIPLPVPSAENSSAIMTQLITILEQGDVAAFIFEPLVQGVGGFRFYDASLLSKLIRICHQHGTFTIADEVMTGFARTGPLFASLSLEDAPDFLCLSKGLTGGVMPLAVTSCTTQVYEGFLADDGTKTFFHGHSYTANPVACAAACASLDLLESDVSLEQRAMLSAYFQRAKANLAGHQRLRNVRSLGHIFAADLVSDAEGSYFNDVGSRLAKYFLARSIVIRPLGHVFYLMPPYCIAEDALDQIFATFEEFLQNENS